MVHRMKNIVVLVGEKLNIDVIGYNVDIAVNVLELTSKVKENTDCIIIEGFNDTEYEELKLIIKGERNYGRKVYFYVPNNDENVCGLADELDMEIYMYMEDILKEIEK